VKILFVWPNTGGFGCKPMGISLLAAALRRAGHDVALFDTTFCETGGTDYTDDLTKHGYFKETDLSGIDLEKKDDLIESLCAKMGTFKPDIIAISALTDELPISKVIANAVKLLAPSVRIIWGNKGVSMASDSVEGLSDLIVQGEAVGSIEHLLKASGVVPPSGYFKDLDSLPYLHWDFFDDRQFIRQYDGKVYRGGDHMIGWGCPNECTYCINKSWRALHGNAPGFLRMYSVPRIIEELAWLKKKWRLEMFKFHDEDFLLKPMPYLKKLSEEYSKTVGLPFVCMAHPKTITKKKVALLKQMGCVSLSIGIESGSQSMRDRLGRKDTPEHICRATKLLSDAGIRVSAFNMIGLPGETPATIKATIDLNREAGIEHPNISFFFPLPGTELHEMSVHLGYYQPGTPMRTDRPTLGLPGITEKQLLWFYRNFANLVRMPQGEYDEAMCSLPDA